MPRTATRDPTDAELLLLGLLAEMPRHGYELEQEIARRGLREWTQIAFSSVYFVLGKLQAAGLVRAVRRATSAVPPTARKTFALTAAGQRALQARTEQALQEYRSTYPSVLLGMLHWPALGHAAALAALQARVDALAAERSRLADLQLDQQPLPDFVEAVFDYQFAQLDAEADWIARTLDYMRTRPVP